MVMALRGFSNQLAHIAVVAAGGRARALILLVGLLLTAWQVYFFVWRPLQQETTLPAGVTSVTAELDAQTLIKLQDARAQRLQHPPNLFPQADVLFVASPLRAAPAP